MGAGTTLPIAAGEILVEEFMQPMGLTQAALAKAMGVQRKHVNELMLPSVQGLIMRAPESACR
jgi:addiction module HigA family antidote